MLYFKSPLSWPETMPVTSLMQQRSDNGFSIDIPLTDAVNFLRDEIDAAGIGYAVLYTDYEQPNVDRLRRKVGSRTGACLHIKYRERGYILACDRWQRIEHNIYAMHLVLRQWSNMEKWGLGSMATLMAGFEVDRAPDSGEESMTPQEVAACLSEFGLSHNATLDDATAIYHRRAKLYAHDNEHLVKLNLQMDAIRNYFAPKNS